MRASHRFRRHLWRLTLLAMLSTISLGASTQTTSWGKGDEELLLTGMLRADRADLLFAPVTTVRNLQLKWLIDEGSQVAPGDAVARFDPERLEESLARNEDKLAEVLQRELLEQTAARLTKLNLDLALAKAESEFRIAELEASVPEELLEGVEFRERQLTLAKKQRALDDARFALSTQELTRVANAEATKLELAELRDAITQAEQELGALVLRAHQPGIVVHESHPWEGRKFREGDRVRAGWLVASIPELDSLEVIAWAAEPDLPHLARGQGARLRLDAYPERSFRGRILSIGRGGERRAMWGKTPYFRIRLTIEKVDVEIMKPGMSARVLIDPLPMEDPS